QYIQNSINKFQYILWFGVLFILIDLQVTYQYINIDTLENPLTLVIAILTIYGILYAFIQFAIGYANQKESDKYWGRSSMEKLLLQHVEFVIFHSNFFKFLLIYSVFFALLNWEEILFIEPYHDIIIAAWQVIIAIISVLYIFLFTKSLFIMKQLFTSKKRDEIMIQNEIEKDMMSDYYHLFIYTYKYRKSFFFNALLKEAQHIERSDRADFFVSIVLNTLKKFEDKQIKRNRNSNKKRKKEETTNLYNMFFKLYRDKRLYDLSLTLDNLLTIYKHTEIILYNELVWLATNAEDNALDTAKFLKELTSLYTNRALCKECTYYHVPQIILNKVHTHQDLCKLHKHIIDKDANNVIIKQKNQNEKSCDITKLITSESRYINTMLDYAKQFIDVYDVDKDKFIFYKAEDKNIQDKIYNYIISMDYTEKNRDYINVLFLSLDDKYRVALVFYIMLYPSDESFMKRKQDVLHLRQLMQDIWVKDEINNPEIKEFVLKKIEHSNIAHRVSSDVIKWIFDHLYTATTEARFIQSCIDFQYVTYATMLKLKYILTNANPLYLDSSSLNNVIIKQQPYTIDWKIRFFRELLKTPELIQKSLFERHIIFLSEQIVHNSYDELLQESDVRLLYMNPFFTFTEDAYWSVLINKYRLGDALIKFLILKLDESGYTYLLKRRRISTDFKERVINIIYQSNFALEAYIDDLAHEVNETSLDKYVTPIKKERIIYNLRKFIYD